jgi:flavin reductase (DIM6/NTAB) family NADH-FMN oxidoreductase RutF
LKSKKQVGKALGRVASGLFVVTAKHEDREDALLASWVNQCSFDPPAVTLAVAKTRPLRLLVEASDRFIVNVLGKESKALLKHFSRPPSNSVFEGLNLTRGFHDIPVLKDAVSCLECELTGSVVGGDHVVYVGKVVGGKVLAGREPYTHVRETGFSY